MKKSYPYHHSLHLVIIITSFLRKTKIHHETFLHNTLIGFFLIYSSYFDMRDLDVSGLKSLAFYSKFYESMGIQSHLYLHSLMSHHHLRYLRSILKSLTAHQIYHLTAIFLMEDYLSWSYLQYFATG